MEAVILGLVVVVAVLAKDLIQSNRVVKHFERNAKVTVQDLERVIAIGKMDVTDFAYDEDDVRFEAEIAEIIKENRR